MSGNYYKILQNTLRVFQYGKEYSSLIQQYVTWLWTGNGLDDSCNLFYSFFPPWEYVCSFSFLPRKEECKISSLVSAGDCFLTLFSTVNCCCPWDNLSVWTHWGMQSLALLTVQNVLRDGFQTIMNVLFVVNSDLPLGTSGLQMFMFPAIKVAWHIRSEFS